MTYPIPLRRRTPAERRAYLEGKRGQVPDEILDAMLEAVPDQPTELRIVTAEAVKFRPGDRVLLTLNDRVGWTKDQLADADRLLRQRFPGVEFTLLSGIEQVALVAPDEL